MQENDGCDEYKPEDDEGDNGLLVGQEGFS